MAGFRRFLLVGFLAVLGLLFIGEARGAAAEPAYPWYVVDAKQQVRIQMYVFWSKTCGKCPRAIDYLRDLEQRTPWLDIHYYEITEHPGNRALYQTMATNLGRVAGQVPAFVFCRDLEIGFDSADTTGARIERTLKRWYDVLSEHHKKRATKEQGRSVGLAPALFSLFMVIDPGPPLPEHDLPLDLPIDIPPEEPAFRVPLLGEMQAADLSLPALTVVLAACDAFNPCAFFVLLFLLGILLHSNSRSKMILVGSIFVFFSGLVYFLFMAAWLNLFFVIGHLRIITLLAAAAALLVALLNIKDFFWFKQGASLAIPDSARPSLIQRARALVHQSAFVPLVFGTVVLAALVNLYELLCTAGFPMIYTRVLTLRQLPTSSYYLYLVLYNLIYVLPLGAIVAAFSCTLGGHKLTEYEGRVLKLLSGTMMLLLGLLLLVAPEALNQIGAAIAMLVGALALTAAVVLLDRWLHRSTHHAHSG